MPLMRKHTNREYFREQRTLARRVVSRVEDFARVAPHNRHSTSAIRIVVCCVCCVCVFGYCVHRARAIVVSLCHPKYIVGIYVFICSRASDLTVNTRARIKVVCIDCVRYRFVCCRIVFVRLCAFRVYVSMCFQCSTKIFTTFTTSSRMNAAPSRLINEMCLV